MKSFSFNVLLMCLMMVPALALGQDDHPLLDKDIKIQVNQINGTFEGKTGPGWSVFIETDYRALVKLWKKHMKDRYKAKLKGRDPMKAETAIISDVLPNQVTVWSTIRAEGTGCVLQVFLEQGGGVFVSSETHPEGAAKMKKNITEFVKSHYTNRLNKLLRKAAKENKSGNKELKKVEKEKAKLENRIVSDQKHIAKNNKAHAKAQQKIREAEEKMEELKSEIGEYEESIKKTKEKQEVTKKELEAKQKVAAENSDQLKKITKKIDAIKKID